MPLKNIRHLAGKPLIAYMITAARQSHYLQRIIVSTDHSVIKKISLRYGAEVPFVRPKKISGNNSSVLVTQHAVRFIEKEIGQKIDIAVTLQPTSPFCQSEDIDACIKLLLKNKTVSSVFSAVEIHERPEWMFRLKDGEYAEPYISGTLRGRRIVRQFYEKLFIPNGAIYATRREALFDENALIAKRTSLYVMPRERSIDIDEEIDLKFAEFLRYEQID